MADVKSITVHGETYDIKDETARNSISTLNETVSTLESHDSQHTQQITALQASVSDNSSDIDTLQESLGSVTSRITAAESNISTLTTQTSGNTASISSLDGRMGSAESEINTLKTQMATKITGDWYSNNVIPQADLGIQKTPEYTVLDFGTENLQPGYYLVTMSNLALQNGSGNMEITFFENGQGTLIANIPASSDRQFVSGTGIVQIYEGTNSIGIGVRCTQTNTGVIKAYSAVYITLVKIKNL